MGMGGMGSDNTLVPIPLLIGLVSVCLGSVATTLTIAHALRKHSGNYTCAVGSLASATVAVHILNEKLTTKELSAFLNEKPDRDQVITWGIEPLVVDYRVSKARSHSASFGATRANPPVYRYQTRGLPLEPRKPSSATLLGPPRSQTGHCVNPITPRFVTRFLIFFQSASHSPHRTRYRYKQFSTMTLFSEWSPTDGSTVYEQRSKVTPRITSNSRRGTTDKSLPHVYGTIDPEYTTAI
uniref:Uncharacterized protein n=1 Tax=Timema bartmani TaxID=61472 RepID=A0A7R9I5U1_9NEOP|nr:unnamed protein product [Timema bartmani]